MKKITVLTLAALALTGLDVQAAEPQKWTAKDLEMAHPNLQKPVDLGSIKVAKAAGPEARTVEEVIGQRSTLKDKPVVVAGKVVKFHANIMNRNWVHLRDGSGSDAAQNNDLVVTTQEQFSTGDVVTVRGVVRADQDFGSGYAYKVLVEEAKKVKP